MADNPRPAFGFSHTSFSMDVDVKGSSSPPRSPVRAAFGSWTSYEATYASPSAQEAFRERAFLVAVPSSSTDSSPRKHKSIYIPSSCPSSPSSDELRRLCQDAVDSSISGEGAGEPSLFARRSWMEADSSPSRDLLEFSPSLMDDDLVSIRSVSPTPLSFVKALSSDVDEYSGPEEVEEILGDFALHGRCFRTLSSRPSSHSTEDLFDDPDQPDAVAGVASQSAFVHSFTRVKTKSFEDPLVEQVEVEASADNCIWEREWEDLLEGIRREKELGPKGLTIDDEGRLAHPKYAKMWNFSRSPEGDLLVDTPVVTSSLDFLDPRVPAKDRLVHSYFDSVPRVAALILLAPHSPSPESPLLPPKVLEAVLALKAKSVIEQTLKANAGVVGFWLKFCDENKVKTEHRFPANPQVLLGYLATRVNQRNGEFVRSSTVAKDFGAIKFWHNLHGLKLEVEPGEWSMLLKGLKTVEAPPLQQRRHLLIDELLDVRKHLDFDNAFDVAVWAATLVGFFGMMRSGEFTTPTAVRFDPKVHVTRANISYEEKKPDAPENFRIHLPWDKTNKSLGRDVGIIASSPNPLVDPIKALKTHLAVNAPPSNTSLFAYRLRDKSGHRQLTKSAWRDRVNACLKAAGHERISGHEIRIGGCNYYVQLKMKHGTIQKLGGWKSPVWLHYWRDTIGHAAREIKTIQDRLKKGIIAEDSEDEDEEEEDE